MSDVERIAQTYSPFDQDETLPPPPWKPTDPALVAWEKAHGHDVRLKCYPEFGCQVIEQALEREIERLLAALARRDAAIQAVRVLHFARGRNILGYPVCDACTPLQPMPCPTLTAIAAELETER